jgi:hypothetical protein
MRCSVATQRIAPVAMRETSRFGHSTKLVNPLEIPGLIDQAHLHTYVSQLSLELSAGEAQCG